MNIKVRRALLVLAVLLLLTLAWFGMRGGVQEWSQAESIGQRVQTAAQFAYGLFALLTLAFISRAGTLGYVVRVSWLVAITVAAGMAPVAWGNAAWWSGLLAGLAALIIGLLILWLLRVGGARVASNNGMISK